VNLVPREGGNVFRGSFFATAASSRLQADNYSQELKDRGLSVPNSLKSEYDINPGGGGPLLRDRLWWFAAARWNRVENNVAGMFANANANNPNAWTYVPDESRRATAAIDQRSVNLRLTWQASARNKFSAFYDDQGRCECDRVTATTSPESAGAYVFPINHMAQVTWTSPLTSHVLLQASVYDRSEKFRIGYSGQAPPPFGSAARQMIPVVEQAGLIPGLLYRGIGGQAGSNLYLSTTGTVTGATAALSYVTGTHALKFGFSDTAATRDSYLDDNAYNLSFRFNNTVPNQLTDRTVDSIVKDADELALLRGRTMVVRRLKALPIEAVVRGYLIGSGWKDYQKTGALCGITLPPGMKQAERLAQPLFTPASKAPVGQHDENISFADVAKLVGSDLAAKVRDTAIAIYNFAAEHARSRGIIIADTKFEFGLDAAGQLVLIDEVLTPDSSRFWPADTYEVGTSPPSFDKQFVRDYLETLDWNKKPPGPSLPVDIIQKTSANYREALRRLTT